MVLVGKGMRQGGMREGERESFGTGRRISFYIHENSGYRHHRYYCHFGWQSFQTWHHAVHLGCSLVGRACSSHGGTLPCASLEKSPGESREGTDIIFLFPCTLSAFVFHVLLLFVYTFKENVSVWMFFIFRCTVFVAKQLILDHWSELSTQLCRLRNCLAGILSFNCRQWSWSLWLASLWWCQK